MESVNRCREPANILLSVIAVAMAIITAIALAIFFAAIAPPLCLFPGAYLIVASISCALSISSIAILITRICSQRWQKLDFQLPWIKPKNVVEEDWKKLQQVPIDFLKRQAFAYEKRSGLKQDYIKISRAQYNLNYSYILHRLGTIYRSCHKSSKRGSKEEQPIGKGRYKKVYHCYDEKDNPSLVRAVVYQESPEEFLILSGIRLAYQQYPHDEEIVVGEPHIYPSFQKEIDRLVLYCPKKICLYDAMEKMEVSSRQEIISIFRKLLTLVKKIHEDGGAHRDIKLENVYIEKEASGEIKVFIMDFDTYTRTAGTAAGTLEFQPYELWEKSLELEEFQEIDVYGCAMISVHLYGQGDNDIWPALENFFARPGKNTFSNCLRQLVDMNDTFSTFLIDVMKRKEGFKKAKEVLEKLDSLVLN